MLQFPGKCLELQKGSGLQPRRLFSTAAELVEGLLFPGGEAWRFFPASCAGYVSSSQVPPTVSSRELWASERVTERPILPEPFTLES